ncbi:copper homeostasis protein CutC [Wenxinia marina]|uniref:PF03932 family protein CutC n=1 Tax=Wenxinia marina DSM 24838 TaxID=1123501 RepID=A0A0D0NNL4_9RHOB|nr:copper homeostasis protein CutC [Wenxinia marina]KIQ69850.1 Uncharacterized protein involved in copper resistance [Wenxinia marina DSM 24838]GGL61691.1 copper homeostasis protein CutC [Wenxinia marina]
MTALEICVDTPEGIATAATAGADRIELCAALGLGGLTPSAGLIAAALAAEVPAHAMVRPRAGGFVLSEADLRAMLADVEAARRAGLAGVVIGAARPGGTLDADDLARLREAAGPMAVTLHRVIDLTPDPLEAVETAVSLCLDRILTSGQAPTAPEGAELIAAMVAQAAGRIEIMAGGGVTPASAQALLATGVDALHASCAVAADDGAPGIGLPASRLTDAAAIRALRAAMTEVRACA